MNRAIAVLDTNVFVELASCHDLIASQDRSDAEREYRANRAASALRLAIYLHETRATTLLYGPELVNIVTARVPPEEESFARGYIDIFLYFTRDYLLSAWDCALASDMRPDLRSNAVDDALVELAAKLDIPMITNEGYGHDGSLDRDKRVHARAATLKVQVMQPAEFYRGHLKAAMVERFMQSFVDRAPDYLRNENSVAVKQQYLNDIHGFYSRLLRATARVDEWQ